MDDNAAGERMVCATFYTAGRFLALLLALGLTAEALAGGIEGTVTNPAKCSGVQALLRKGAGVKYPALPKVFPAQFDSATGAFKVSDLPEGEYDLRLIVPGGQVDGFDARLTPAPKDSDPFNAEDEAALKDFVATYPDRFSDILRPVVFCGNGAYAKVLVEEIRAREFHSGEAGDIIWRMEVWAFEKQTGAWVRSKRGTETIARLRVMRSGASGPGGDGALQTDSASFDALVWQFAPALGRWEIGATDTVKGLALTVPDPSESGGKIAGSVRRQIEAYHKAHPEPYLE